MKTKSLCEVPEVVELVRLLQMLVDRVPDSQFPQCIIDKQMNTRSYSEALLEAIEALGFKASFEDGKVGRRAQQILCIAFPTQAAAQRAKLAKRARKRKATTP